MKLSAFTLIEMLVVVAIVATLALFASAFSVSSIDRAYFTQVMSLGVPLLSTAKVNSFQTGSCTVQGARTTGVLEKISSYKYTSDGSICRVWLKLSSVEGPDSMHGGVIRLSYNLDDAVSPFCETSVAPENYKEEFCQYNPALRAAF